MDPPLLAVASTAGWLHVFSASATGTATAADCGCWVHAYAGAVSGQPHLSFSPDGRYLAVASGETWVLRWYPEDGGRAWDCRPQAAARVGRPPNGTPACQAATRFAHAPASTSALLHVGAGAGTGRLVVLDTCSGSRQSGPHSSMAVMAEQRYPGPLAGGGFLPAAAGGSELVALQRGGGLAGGVRLRLYAAPTAAAMGLPELIQVGRGRGPDGVRRCPTGRGVCICAPTSCGRCTARGSVMWWSNNVDDVRVFTCWNPCS